MAVRCSARSTAAPPVSRSAYRAAVFARRSTSMSRAHSDRLPVFPSQLCEEAPHPSEGGSVAAQCSLPHLINSFSTASSAASVF
ncbi:uncharacterized protein V6R79_020130 [Siganus canaliculatus]